MKQIHILLLLLTTILSLMGIVSCKDKVITAEKLPAIAKSFIGEHFPENPVSFVKKEEKLAGFLPVWSPPQSPSMYKAISPASSSS